MLTCSVARAGQRPMLFLPGKSEALPRGEVNIVANGFELVAHVRKIAINKVTAPGPTAGTANLLPDILKAWFGRDAGSPGRKERVTLRQVGARWLMEPVVPTTAAIAA